MKHTRMRTKKVKAWAIVTARGAVTGMAPYNFYSMKKFADYYAVKANASRGGGLKVVRCSVSYTITNPRSRKK